MAKPTLLIAWANHLFPSILSFPFDISFKNYPESYYFSSPLLLPWILQSPGKGDIIIHALEINGVLSSLGNFISFMHGELERTKTSWLGKANNNQ